MDKIELKSGLHSFIDKIDNIELLKEYYNELKNMVKSSASNVWNNLSEDQRKEVLLSFEESEDESNLIDNNEVSNFLKP